MAISWIGSMNDLQARFLAARQKYLARVGSLVKMPYRPGDPTVEVEAIIELTTAKAYLLKPTMGKLQEVWLPKSQMVGMTDPAESGARLFTVTQWWADKSGVLDE
jgi:hypothetical protein